MAFLIKILILITNIKLMHSRYVLFRFDWLLYFNFTLESLTEKAFNVLLYDLLKLNPNFVLCYLYSKILNLILCRNQLAIGFTSFSKRFNTSRKQPESYLDWSCVNCAIYVFWLLILEKVRESINKITIVTCIMIYRY